LEWREFGRLYVVQSDTLYRKGTALKSIVTRFFCAIATSLCNIPIFLCNIAMFFRKIAAFLKNIPIFLKNIPIASRNLMKLLDAIAMLLNNRWLSLGNAMMLL
jgi:hypothetical protein